MSTVLCSRVASEPVVSPGTVPGYGPITNAGLIHHDGRYHLFARGVRNGYRRNPDAGPRFLDYRSDVLVFTSVDGNHYDFQQVLATGGTGPVYCYEDPRVQRVTSNGQRHFMMTYTHLATPESNRPWMIGIHRLVYRDGAFRLNRTSGGVIGPPGVPNKDAVLFNLLDGRVAMLHRIHPNIQLAVFSSIAELRGADAAHWDDHLANLEHHTILRPTPGALGIGAGAPPIRLGPGLVLFFHERRGDGSYAAKAALLDPSTGRVMAQMDQPVLEPDLAWEREGDVDNVIFVQGAHRRADGTIYLTYGAADRSVGAALVDETELLAALAA